MIKFLLILILGIFIIARFAAYFFRIVYWLTGQTPPSQRRRQDASSTTETKSGGLKIIIPQKQRKKGQFDGGEYIDFEEVKENKK